MNVRSNTCSYLQQNSGIQSATGMSAVQLCQLSNRWSETGVLEARLVRPGNFLPSCRFLWTVHISQLVCSKSAIPPPIDLPDVQLQNHLWETYVNAQISQWIDCDSDDEELAALSEVELQKVLLAVSFSQIGNNVGKYLSFLSKELNYCAYMGLRSAVFRLKHADSPRLARILNQWLWTRNVNLGWALLFVVVSIPHISLLIVV